MTDETRIAGKRGKLAPERLLSTSLRDYMKVSLPSTPASIDYGTRVPNYPLADNAKLGCCTISGVVHLLQLQYAEIGETFTYPGDAEVETTYFAQTDGVDSGCVETSILNTWKNTGLFGTKITSWIPINPKAEAEMRAAVYLFGGVYLGVELPADAEQQFEDHKPWHLTIPRGRPVGGHCVVGSGYNREVVSVITWGQETVATWDWMERYCSEAYVTIHQEFVEADHGPLYKIDIQQLEADMKLF